MDHFQIFYDSLTEALWFANLNPFFDFNSPQNQYIQIGRRGNNPRIIEQLTSYDKPDIILLKNDVPVLTIEKTQEVPTGHNVGQRFARLVKSIELDVPVIYFFPFDAKKHGAYEGICNLNIRLLDAAQKIFNLHRTPLLCVNWLTDASGEIITDGSEDYHMRSLLNSYITSGFNKHCQLFMAQLSNMQQEYYTRLQRRPSYANLPPSVVRYPTNVFIRNFGITNVPSSFMNRPYTYVYSMDMTPAKCKRQDPYTGTAFIYDYQVCRNGINVGDKCNNLVLNFPSLTKEIWACNNPNDSTTKSCNWYLTANLFTFNNGHLWIRG